MRFSTLIAISFLVSSALHAQTFRWVDYDENTQELSAEIEYFGPANRRFTLTPSHDEQGRLVVALTWQDVGGHQSQGNHEQVVTNHLAVPTQTLYALLPTAQEGSVLSEIWAPNNRDDAAGADVPLRAGAQALGELGDDEREDPLFDEDEADLRRALGRELADEINATPIIPEFQRIRRNAGLPNLGGSWQ